MVEQETTAHDQLGGGPPNRVWPPETLTRCCPLALHAVEELELQAQEQLH